jgi:hypothetical protein
VLAGKSRTQVSGHLVVVQPLEGGDLRPLAGDCIADAGARGRIVDQERACAAHAVLATKVRSGEQLILAREIGEMGTRLDGGGDGPAVHRETDGLHGRLARWAARSTAVR